MFSLVISVLLTELPLITDEDDYRPLSKGTTRYINMHLLLVVSVDMLLWPVVHLVKLMLYFQCVSGGLI